MAASATTARSLAQARRGRLLSDARREAASGTEELDGGQRLLILDILISALGGA